MRTVGALVLGVAVAAAPALTYAQHGGFGGGHSGGGGGAHFGGGGHVSSGAHFAGGHAAYGGFAGGAHYAAASHFAAPAYHTSFNAAGAHMAGAHFAAAGAAGHGFVGHAGAGFAPGNGYWHGGHYWGGGYWHGVFWPHVWFNPGFAWFLPVLPLGYATFWWGGVPYYYWNNVYYTWDPGYNGYVVNDPPPVAGQNADTTADSADAGGNYTQAAPDYGQPTAQPMAAPVSAPTGGGTGEVFLYPRNGQSDAQTQNDRYECHSWAANQAGFDPTRSGQQSGNAGDYRRAMIACLDARGYSAR
jgi:hypothetical protein